MKQQVAVRNEAAEKITAYGYLFLVAIGSAFATVLVKMYVEQVPPIHLMMARSTASLIFILLVMPKKIFHITKEEWYLGTFLGFFLFFAYITAIIGVKYTTASKAGFLWSLSVLIIPLVETALRRKLPSKWIMISVLSSLVGLKLISGMNGGDFNLGDFLCLMSAAFYTVYIIQLDRKVGENDPLSLTLVQMLLFVLISFIGAAAFEDLNPGCIRSNLWPLILIGVLGTCIPTFLQAKAQKNASPESVGIILLAEPLITMFLAMAVLGEIIFINGWIGAILILFSLLLAVVKRV